MGGARGLKLRTMDNLNAVLARLGSAPAAGAAYSDHETDVLAAAAGLRQIAADPLYWQPKDMGPEIARTEGRPFGVEDRKSGGEGKGWAVRVELGGRRIITKKKKN